MSAKKAMTVEELRAFNAAPKLLTLPPNEAGESKVVKIRRLTPIDYIQNGVTEIPNEFYKFVLDLQNGNLKASVDSEPEKVQKSLDLYEKFMRITIEQGILEPSVMFTYDASKAKTHALFGEFSAEEQMMIINAITGKR